MTLHVGPGARQRLLGIGLLCVTFITGGIAGASFQQVLASRTAEAQDAREQRRGGSGRSSERGRSNDDFPYVRLQVTEEQRPQIERILNEGQKKVNDFWRRTQPQLRATVDSTRAEIRAVLTPEQNMQWDSLRAADRRSRRSGGRGQQPR